MRPSYEKLAYWLCVAILAGLAAVYSLSLLAELMGGQISSFGKGARRVLVFGNDPYGFLGALMPHLMLNGFFWYGAYWIWFSHIRSRGD